MISVLCPLFNEELYLDEMLASLINQSFTDWEAILVDDGSTDQTPAIMHRWAERESRIRVASAGTKLGKVNAFNLALESARGDFICHVGGDDVLPVDSFLTRVRALSVPSKRAVVLGKLQMIDADGVKLGAAIPRGARGSQSSPGATYTRDLCEMIFPIPQELPSEDIWLGNAAVGCSERVVHVPDVLIYYRVHRGNSNPRAKPFEVMTEAMHDRARALHLLVKSDLPLSPAYRRTLEGRWKAEVRRYRQDLSGLLLSGEVGMVDRIALASMSKPLLWRLRQALGVLGSGWRGR